MRPPAMRVRRGQNAILHSDCTCGPSAVHLPSESPTTIDHIISSSAVIRRDAEHRPTLLHNAVIKPDLSVSSTRTFPMAGFSPRILDLSMLTDVPARFIDSFCDTRRATP